MTEVFKNGQYSDLPLTVNVWCNIQFKWYDIIFICYGCKYSTFYTYEMCGSYSCFFVGILCDAVKWIEIQKCALFLYALYIGC